LWGFPFTVIRLDYRYWANKGLRTHIHAAVLPARPQQPRKLSDSSSDPMLQSMGCCLLHIKLIQEHRTENRRNTDLMKAESSHMRVLPNSQRVSFPAVILSLDRRCSFKRKGVFYKLYCPYRKHFGQLHQDWNCQPFMRRIGGCRTTTTQHHAQVSTRLPVIRATFAKRKQPNF
jgi:hypothetical protein